MGHDDHERKFEQALARHLRDGVARETDANAPDPGPAEAEALIACPDTTMLAAFHERMLSNEEMNVAKEHIAVCSRCQEILALLEATDEIAVNAEEESVLEMGEPVLAGSARYDEGLAHMPRATVAAQPAGVLKASQDISRARGARMWRWVAPAGAIAAGLLIWVVTHEFKPQTLTPVGKIQVAQERPANGRLADDRSALMTPAPERTARTGRLDNAVRNEKRLKQAPAEEFTERHIPDGEPKGALGGTVGGIVGGATSDSIARSLRRESRNDVLRGVTPAKPAGSVARQGDVTVSAAAPPVNTNEAQIGMDKKGDLPVMARDAARNTLNKEKLEPGAAAAPTAPRAQPSAPTSEAAKTAAKHSANAAEKKEADTNAAALATAQTEVTADYERTSSLQNENAEDAQLILTPGGTVLWRLRGKGRIERSADRGITWSRQNSGVMLELLAGSAPSDEVCWVVGRRGTILRTTDGGGHWNKAVSPIAGDAGGIRAVDAMHATIFDGNGRESFATNDGGVTWTPVKL